MEIINATWEKRNFNMDAFEINLTKKDLKDFDAVLKKIDEQNFKNAYVVIKMPVGNLKALHKLEDLGYRFLETQFHLVQHFEPKLDDYKNLIENSNDEITLEFVPKEREAWERVIKKITPGMFDTDRVSLDPELGEEIACKRYQNWCMDLFEKPNSRLVVRKINGVEFGFGLDIIDEKTGTVDGILGGIFAEFKGSGLGSVYLNDTNKLNNIKTSTKTSVSSNNLNIFKIHQQCGKIVAKEKYILRKIYK